MVYFSGNKFYFFGLILNSFKKIARNAMSKDNWSNIIYDINGNILVKANQIITPDLIKKITKKLKIHVPKVVISQTSIINELITEINSGIYKVIFSNKENTQEIIDIISSTRIPYSIVQELENIKKTLPDTFQHILMVGAISTKIGIDLRHEGYNLTNVAEIGLVHDLGKSRLPKEILLKNSPLTHEEFEIIKTHPLIDNLLISYYLKNNNALASRVSLLHHERLDGSGYPRGIQALNKYVQLLIPCDIFNALISERPYRNSPYSVRAALDLLLEEAKQGKISENIVLRLISYVRKDKPKWDDLKLSREKRDTPPQINYYGIRTT